MRSSGVSNKKYSAIVCFYRFCYEMIYREVEDCHHSSFGTLPFGRLLSGHWACPSRSLYGFVFMIAENRRSVKTKRRDSQKVGNPVLTLRKELKLRLRFDVV